MLKMRILVVAVAAAWGVSYAQQKAAEPTEAAAAPAAAAPSGEGLPPNAKPGECYARIVSPAVFKTVAEKIEKTPASEKVEIIPAKFAQAEERVIVKPASKKLEHVPAVYETIEEKVEVKPASKKFVQVPAVYENVTERVMVRPGYTTWKKGSGAVQKVDDATGDIMCLVEVPPVYENITKKVLKVPAATKEVEVAAEFKVVKKRILKTPASTREVEVPAEYKTITVMKEIEPAKEVRVPVPAEFTTVTKTLKEAEGRVEWRSILCDTNATKEKVAEIQSALRKAGFNPGPVDGRLSGKTMAAVNAFQRANNLPIDKYLNLETVKALGVSAN